MKFSPEGVFKAPDRSGEGEPADAGQAMLERGQMDAHMTTLLRFSPEAARLVVAAKDPMIPGDEFLAQVQNYNEQHASGVAADELLESFTVPLLPGRTIDVSLYKTGRVVLAAADGSVH